MSGATATFLGADRQTWLSIAIGTIVSILVAYLVYLRQKRPKTLDYASYKLQSLKAKQEILPGLTIEVRWSPPYEFYPDPESEPDPPVLENAQLATYRTQNTGKRAIKADDFQEPITIKTPHGILVDCVVTAASYSGVCELGSVYVSCYGPPPPVDKVSFTPALLNPGDWLEVSVLTDGLEGHCDISCWIVEQSRPMGNRQRILGPSIRDSIGGAIKDSFPLSLEATSMLGAATVGVVAGAIVRIFG